MQSGACNCLAGVGGYKCDTCARGYIGSVPDCIACGECFDNWDRILQEAKSNKNYNSSYFTQLIDLFF